jgi:hypothetical protein
MKPNLDKATKYTQYVPTTEKATMPSRLDPSRPQRTEDCSSKTAFKIAHDVTMASRQTKYESLPRQEQKKQEQWVQKKLRELGPCLAGFDWLPNFSLSPCF